MTSQDTSEVMKELQAKAKGAGVKSPHLYKSEKSLTEAINKVHSAPMVAQVEEVVNPPVESVRKKAPKMNVAGIGQDDRELLIKQLEVNDPDSKYLFDRGDITDKELAAKGHERTEYAIRNDIVTRTDKKSFDEWNAAKNKANRRIMDAVDPDGVGVRSHMASRRTPINADSR